MDLWDIFIKAHFASRVNFTMPRYVISSQHTLQNPWGNHIFYVTLVVIISVSDYCINVHYNEGLPYFFILSSSLSFSKHDIQTQPEHEKDEIKNEISALIIYSTSKKQPHTVHKCKKPHTTIFHQGGKTQFKSKVSHCITFDKTKHNKFITLSFKPYKAG